MSVTNRVIVGIVRHERATELRLACGHHRSIGGHVFPNGAPCPQQLMADAAMTYPCADGHCGGR